MRFHSLTVRNYRIHREITVEFDPARNLIGGPNETGKSTLAEAMHRALFFRHRSGGEPQQLMRSELHNGHPEVKLVFETGGRIWTLEKRFSGTSGTARLSSNDGSSLQGDAAEDELSKLIGNPGGPVTTLKNLALPWSHLWVWQGFGGNDATVHAASHKDQLVRRLQQEGLSAVMQSPADEAVREGVRRKHEEIFTKTGSAKAGSALDQAAKRHAEADAALSRAEEQKQKLAAAVAEQESATRLAADANQALPALREETEAADTKLQRVAELRGNEEKQRIVQANAKGALRQIEQADRQILTLREQQQALEKSLVPSEARLAVLADGEKWARGSSTAADQALRSASDGVRLARQHHDLATVCVSQFEKAAAVDALTARQAEILTIRQSRDDRRGVLAALPVITPADLEAARKLDSQIGRAEGALAAMAAGIEVVSADMAVLLNGKPMEAGRSEVIVETAELSLGSGTVLRIQPGGGTSLTDARRKVEELRREFSAVLDRMTVQGLAEAEGILTRRQSLENEIRGLDSNLKSLGAKDLPDSLAAATTARTSALAEVEHRRALIPAGQAPTLPESPEAARIWQKLTTTALQEAERQEQSLLSHADTVRKALENAEQAHRSHQEGIEAERKEAAKLEVQIHTLEQSHGDATARTLALTTARLNEARAKAELDATLGTLAGLKPESLESERTRISRALSLQESNLREAENRILTARAVLALDGSRDPDAELLEARARTATMAEEHAREDRRASAIALLHRLFSESQTEITKTVTQPIADRVAGYLECVFGPGVRIQVELAENDNSSLSITRPDGPAFSFDSLSGGAREQVAAAVRLATAEILAADHDGCLPLLFDDAFAYADPERVKNLQRMLDLAATRGLQLIVLTCTPADYIGFGAKECRLPQTAAPL